MSNQDLINKAYEMGCKSTGIESSAPHANKEFMDIVPNCEFGDNDGVKLKVAMFKAYINGWTTENLSQRIDNPIENLEGQATLTNVASGQTWKK